MDRGRGGRGGIGYTGSGSVLASARASDIDSANGSSNGSGGGGGGSGRISGSGSDNGRVGGSVGSAVGGGMGLINIWNGVGSGSGRDEGRDGGSGRDKGRDGGGGFGSGGVTLGGGGSGGGSDSGDGDLSQNAAQAAALKKRDVLRRAHEQRVGNIEAHNRCIVCQFPCLTDNYCYHNNCPGHSGAAHVICFAKMLVSLNFSKFVYILALNT
jgi:hypothetical protein